MKLKNNVITILITLIIVMLLVICNTANSLDSEANNYYQVYLNGHKIGVIEDKEKLYKLIDSSQSAIKNEYQVNNVYPPTDLKIIETNSYVAQVDDVISVYKKIEEEDNFAIKGYAIYIGSGNKQLKVNVLDKELFYTSAKRFVRAFLNEDEYEKYINDNQEEIVETGRIIRNMKFKEEITIKEEYINVNDKIYTNELDLTHFLLFGSNPETKSYTIKLGDTIESISENNKLNVEEFLIANINYKTADSLLRVGDKVNVTLINPQLTFVYELYEIKDEIVYFTKETVEDKTKPRGWSEITQAGINGMNRYEEIYSVTNGERSQEAKVKQIATLVEVQNQITTKGTKYVGGGISNNINPVEINGDWGWTTNKGYVITSPWGWRWGKLHQGVDISGAGNLGSPIYAAGDGVVSYVYTGCPTNGRGYGDPCGGSLGNMVTIKHPNGYITKYAHLHKTVIVKVGQEVKKGEVIGYMGNSGSSTGAHLHFAVAKDTEYNYFNPMLLYR